VAERSGVGDRERGVGRSYQGERGAAYLEYQRRFGELGAELNRFKFERFLNPGDAVVDFGCGIGALLERLPAASKCGIEVNELARREAMARGLRVVESARDLQSDSADVVISNHALEHTIAPLDELRELLRILRPSGRLVIWLPIDDWRTQRHPGTDPNHHLYTWTPQLLSNLLAEAGFEVQHCRVVTHAWPPFTALLARLPRPVFDVLAHVWAVLRRRRQVMAIACK
jgi:SAM-dependent methyltransferase